GAREGEDVVVIDASEARACARLLDGRAEARDGDVDRALAERVVELLEVDQALVEARVRDARRAPRERDDARHLVALEQRDERLSSDEAGRADEPDDHAPLRLASRLASMARLKVDSGSSSRRLAAM